MVDQKRLTRRVRESGKKIKEESPKGKYTSKSDGVGSGCEDIKIIKGKHQYISAITLGATQENLPSKGTMKRNIVEMMAFHKKDRITSTRTPYRLILEF